MELSQLVTSLETSKRLKEFGVKQESLFYYVRESDNDEWKIVFGSGYDWSDYPEYRAYPHKVSAFTSSELGEMLPHRIRNDGLAYDLEFWKSHDKKIGTCYIDMESEHKFLISYEDNNEAESRGKLYIYLKENNLIGKY